MDTVELQTNIWVDSFTGNYILQEKQPNRGLLIYAKGENIPVSECNDYGIDEDGKPSQRGKMSVYKCKECGNPMKHVQTNQWMCDQNRTNCSQSLKIIF